MSDLISDDEKLRCVEREIAMRRIVYPKWAASGKMKQTKADREIEVMEAVAADYREAIAAVRE